MNVELKFKNAVAFQKEKTPKWDRKLMDGNLTSVQYE